MAFALYAAQRLKAAKKKARREAKRARIEAKRTVTLSDGRQAKIPPRWTIKTLRSRLQLELNAAVKASEPAVCISCGKAPLVGADHQAGHFFPVGSFPSVRFDAGRYNIAPQCSRCNGYLHGNHAAYAAAYLHRHGAEALSDLASKAHDSRQFRPAELLELLEALRSGGLSAYKATYTALEGKQ